MCNLQIIGYKKVQKLKLTKNNIRSLFTCPGSYSRLLYTYIHKNIYITQGSQAFLTCFVPLLIKSVHGQRILHRDWPLLLVNREILLEPRATLHTVYRKYQADIHNTTPTLNLTPDLTQSNNI